MPAAISPGTARRASNPRSLAKGAREWKKRLDRWANGPWMIESVWLRWPIMANHHSPNPSVAAWSEGEDGGHSDAGREGGQVPPGAPRPGRGGRPARRRARTTTGRRTADCFMRRPDGAGEPGEEQERGGRPSTHHQATAGDRDGGEAARQQLAVGGEALEVGARARARRSSAAATTAARRPASAHAAAPTPAVASAAAAMARKRAVGSQPVAATSRYAATRPWGRSTQATGP